MLQNIFRNRHVSIGKCPQVLYQLRPVSAITYRHARSPPLYGHLRHARQRGQGVLQGIRLAACHFTGLQHPYPQTPPNVVADHELHMPGSPETPGSVKLFVSVK